MRKIFFVVWAWCVAQLCMAADFGGEKNATKFSDFFNRVELSAAAAVEQEKVVPRAQMKALFRDAEVRVNGNFGAVSYENPSAEKLAVTYGALFSTQKFLPFDFTVKGGMISASGLYTRLTNPAPTAPSGVFASKARAANALDVRLPGTTSAKKDNGISAHFAFPRKNKFFSNVAADFFLQENGLFAGGASVAFAPTKTSEFGAVFSLGRFWFGKTSTYWFSDTPLFPEDWFYEAAASVYAKNKFLSSVFTATAHEKPTGGINKTFQGKTTLQYGPFSVNLSGFYGGKEIFFCGNGEKEKCEAQFFVNPQIKFVLSSKKLMLANIGVASFAEIEKGDADIKERISQKHFIGASLTKNVFRTALNFSASFSKKQNYETVLSASYAKFAVKPSLSVANTISVPAASSSTQVVAAKQVVTAGAYGTPVNFNGRITGSLSASLTEKFPVAADAYFDAASFSASLDILWRTKYLQVNGKISAKIE